MRRHDREVGDAVWIEKVLNDAQFMTLSLVDGDTPYGVPLNFVYQNGALFFHCALDGKKLDCITQNRKVSACVVGTARLLTPADGMACSIGMSYESIVVSGEASVVSDPAEQQEALNALILKFGGEPATVPPRAMERICIVKIAIVASTGKRANIS